MLNKTTRTIACVCDHPLCYRYTYGYNKLCVRHRNDEKLIQKYELKYKYFTMLKICVEKLRHKKKMNSILTTIILKDIQLDWEIL